jgi:5-methylcytosine-specific restriction endonuclease McrA
MLRDQYRAGGFVEAVRDWHLARIPRLIAASGTYISCPWCGRERDIRSMQIDHIVPIQQYTRYNLLVYALKHKDNRVRMSTIEKDLRILTKTLYSDQKNLSLCCMKCNAGEGKTMPTPEGLRAASASVAGSVLETKLLNLIPFVQDMTKPRRVVKENGVNLNIKEFILNGATWSTTARETRQTKSVITANYSTMIAKLSLIHNTVVEKLVKGRPAFTIVANNLIPFQPSRVFNGEEGRLCFYCLGLFRKQAFQIDHINPASQRSETPSVYSDPTNLIPVCRTCNTGKGIKSLSTLWLDAQIAARQNEGLPGVENANNVLTPHGYASYLDYVKAQRLRVLGH